MADNIKFVCFFIQKNSPKNGMFRIAIVDIVSQLV